MILVVGGMAAGKREFVETRLGYGQNEMSPSLDGGLVVYAAHELVREYSQDELVLRLLEKEVVICDEVGCGVVPLEESERVWREGVGRLCAKLAREATLVIRICCGIPQVLKGTL